MSKSGAQIQNPGGTADRETSGEHAASGGARGAPVRPWKRDKSLVSMAVLA